MSSKIDVPEGIPERGSRAEDLLAWVNIAAKREHNPLIAVQRYGYELDARLVMTMANGDKLRVRQRELMGVNGLRHVMLGYDGTELPGYDQHGCAQIVARIIWASEASVEADEIEALVDDVSAFLDLTLPSGLIAGRYDDLDGHRLVSDFGTLNRQSKLAVLALNEATDPPELWVPRSRLVGHLRELNGKIHVPDLRSSLHELGWRWTNPERRPRGGGRKSPKARVWALPVTWERCAFDLAGTVKNTPRRRSERAA
jgi:hypothetical protein